MLALPHGAADTAGWPRRRRSRRAGCPGRNGARCVATPIGPMPGPPPPCGMANVLCRFRWHTSAPIDAGLSGRPARSCWRHPCTPGRRARARSAQISRIASSNTPCVDGYVIIRHASRSRCSAAFAAQIVHVDVAVRRRWPRRPRACRPWPRWRDWCRAPTPESARCRAASSPRSR